jgi:hypothetical protein
MNHEQQLARMEQLIERAIFATHAGKTAVAKECMREANQIARKLEERAAANDNDGVCFRG